MTPARTRAGDQAVADVHRCLRRCGRSYVHAGEIDHLVEHRTARVGDALSWLEDKGVLELYKERNSAPNLYRVVE